MARCPSKSLIHRCKGFERQYKLQDPCKISGAQQEAEGLAKISIPEQLHTIQLLVLTIMGRIHSRRKQRKTHLKFRILQSLLLNILLFSTVAPSNRVTTLVFVSASSPIAAFIPQETIPPSVKLSEKFRESSTHTEDTLALDIQANKTTVPRNVDLQSTADIDILPIEASPKDTTTTLNTGIPNIDALAVDVSTTVNTDIPNIDALVVDVQTTLNTDIPNMDALPVDLSTTVNTGIPNIDALAVDVQTTLKTDIPNKDALAVDVQVVNATTALNTSTLKTPKTDTLAAGILLHTGNTKITSFNNSISSFFNTGALAADKQSLNKGTPATHTTYRDSIDIQSGTSNNTSHTGSTTTPRKYTVGADLLLVDSSKNLTNGTLANVQETFCNTSVSDYYKLRKNMLSIPTEYDLIADHICDVCLSNYHKGPGVGDRHFLSGFRVLMSMSRIPGYAVYDVPEDLRGDSFKQPIPWWSWTCEISDRMDLEASKSCRVSQCDPRFFLTKDGLCRMGVIAEFSVQEKVLFKGKTCRIDPHAFARATECLTKIYKLVATAKPYRNFQIYNHRAGINVTVVRAEMYFDTLTFENQFTALSRDYNTFYAAILVFAQNHCLFKEERARKMSTTQASSSGPLLNRTFGTSRVTTAARGDIFSYAQDLKMTEMSERFLLKVCLQTGSINEDLDDDVVSCNFNSDLILPDDKVTMNELVSTVEDSQCVEAETGHSKSDAVRAFLSPTVHCLSVMAASLIATLISFTLTLL
ncbi:hypothetical protein ElyMa_003692200 [Elysia marginata]|uniref:Uncharacterized protein n=1 Tax=Elysia marginata TaxID=1093978 RepID=A0AAV4F253_9GAST|nr:hypothetical protein ElyMa_003692200 [Elysia marginata]